MYEYLNPLHQLVRVRDGGQEYNVSRATAMADKLEILENESAYDAIGVPREPSRVVESGSDAGESRPAKPKTSVTAAVAAKKAASSAANTEPDTQPSSEKE